VFESKMGPLQIKPSPLELGEKKTGLQLGRGTTLYKHLGFHRGSITSSKNGKPGWLQHLSCFFTILRMAR